MAILLNFCIEDSNVRDFGIRYFSVQDFQVFGIMSNWDFKIRDFVSITRNKILDRVLC